MRKRIQTGAVETENHWGPKGLRGVSKILSTSYPQGENPLSPSYAQLPQVYPQPVVGNHSRTNGAIGCFFGGKGRDTGKNLHEIAIFLPFYS